MSIFSSLMHHVGWNKFRTTQTTKNKDFILMRCLFSKTTITISLRTYLFVIVTIVCFTMLFSILYSWHTRVIKHMWSMLMFQIRPNPLKILNVSTVLKCCKGIVNKLQQPFGTFAILTHSWVKELIGAVATLLYLDKLLFMRTFYLSFSTDT